MHFSVSGLFDGIAAGMTRSAERLSLVHVIWGFCVTLLLGSCLTPPEARNPEAAQQQQSTVVVRERPPREFGRSSKELIDELALGWNLGNALDAPDGETSWGNPPVTQELLVAVAQAGFDLVRIPVTWSKHMGPGPDYVIEPSWFKRVAEVVG